MPHSTGYYLCLFMVTFYTVSGFCYTYGMEPQSFMFIGVCLALDSGVRGIQDRAAERRRKKEEEARQRELAQMKRDRDYLKFLLDWDPDAESPLADGKEHEEESERFNSGIGDSGEGLSSAKSPTPMTPGQATNTHTHLLKIGGRGHSI